MKISYIILFLSGFMLMQCGGDNISSTDAQATENSEQELKKISAKTIESLDYKDYALSPEAEKEVVSWAEYQELSNQLGFLKKADFSFFKENKDSLKAFIVKFKVNMPDSFRTNPIVSRNAIVETTLLKLNDNLVLDNIDRNDKITGIKEMFVAFSNLNYQINKKLEHDMYNGIQPE